MNHVSLTTHEIRRLIMISSIAAIAVTLMILALRLEALKASPVPTVLQSVSGAVTIVGIAIAWLSAIRWTSDKLAWVMGRAVVHGVWRGSIWTNYGLRDEASARKIEIVFVIQQTYLALSISSYTGSQDGESVIEAMLKSAKTDATQLRYVFQLHRQYAGENKLTSGAGELKLLENGTRLKGHYFTDSPTQGDIDLTRFDRDCTGIDSFEAATKLFASGPRMP